MTAPVRPGPPPIELHPQFPAVYAGLLGLNWEDDGDTLAAATGEYRLAILRPEPHMLRLPDRFALWNALIEADTGWNRWEPPNAVEICRIGPFYYPEDALASVLLRAAALITHDLIAEAYMDRLLDEAERQAMVFGEAGVYDR